MATMAMESVLPVRFDLVYVTASRKSRSCHFGPEVQESRINQVWRVKTYGPVGRSFLFILSMKLQQIEQTIPDVGEILASLRCSSFEIRTLEDT